MFMITIPFKLSVVMETEQKGMILFVILLF